MKEPFWIGLDFDGTLVEHDFPDIGKPVPMMMERLRGWLAEGKCVKIMTARAAPSTGEYGTPEEQIKLIQDWLESQGLPRLEVTATKDYMMLELWDDRAIQVDRNTGMPTANRMYRQGYDEGVMS